MAILSTSAGRTSSGKLDLDETEKSRAAAAGAPLPRRRARDRPIHESGTGRERCVGGRVPRAMPHLGSRCRAPTWMRSSTRGTRRFQPIELKRFQAPAGRSRSQPRRRGRRRGGDAARRRARRRRRRGSEGDGRRADRRRGRRGGATRSIPSPSWRGCRRPTRSRSAWAPRGCAPSFPPSAAAATNRRSPRRAPFAPRDRRVRALPVRCRPVRARGAEEGRAPPTPPRPRAAPSAPAAARGAGAATVARRRPAPVAATPAD